ncbi:hypothetical protein DAPPUDRAFT_318738 [Daphnia pulex]|uniref:Uncharacterized protein n=1 Tax=Daphnia pulex TaxID=6669 RepID=E9GK65_DAPPU|nr:hypothetical protein DAPPUDRAFT_318738 [Daphnia pulex]|eukprot:EFX80297.1 hypothetical protein DAPPUDRAFT_318738 [Daphnia pulex]
MLNFFMVAYQTANPKPNWELKREAKQEREALKYLITPEERARFEEDEAKIREDKTKFDESKFARQKKRKRDAIEEATVRFAEKTAKDQCKEFERKRRRVETSMQFITYGNTATLSTGPFVTPSGSPILPGDLLHEFHQLQAAISADKFRIRGTLSDPITSKLGSTRY